MLEKFTVCACFSEGLRVSYFPEDKEFYVSIWEHKGSGKACWSHRLKHIWRILRTGQPWEDEIIISEQDAGELGQFLISPPSCPSEPLNL